MLLARARDDGRSACSGTGRRRRSLLAADLVSTDSEDALYLETLGSMNAQFAQAMADWREPHVAAGRLRRLPTMLYGLIVVGPAQQYGSEVIAKAEVEDLASEIRLSSPVRPPVRPVPPCVARIGTKPTWESLNFKRPPLESGRPEVRFTEQY